MKEIQLVASRRHPGKFFTKVDDEDFDFLNQWKWRIVKFGYVFYVVRRVGNPTVTILMHRVIMNPKDGFLIDHKDHDGLNNQKSNLRVCTGSQNQMNRRVSPGRRISKYRGVRQNKQSITAPWKAILNKQRRQIFIGSFKTEKEAAIAWNMAAIKHYGEFANPNQIEP